MKKTMFVVLLAFCTTAFAEEKKLAINWTPTVEEAQAFADAVTWDPDKRQGGGWNPDWLNKGKAEAACKQPLKVGIGTTSPIAVWIYTPLCIIEILALEALQSYDKLVVTEEMIPPPMFEVARRPPSGAKYSQSYKMIVLKSTNGRVVERPTEMEIDSVTMTNRMGWEGEYSGVTAWFTPEQIERVQAADKKGEFFIITVASGGDEGKYKLKTKHFKHLH